MTAEWNGVRNYQARNNLKKMKKNDFCFFYHTGRERKIVGIVKVVKEFFNDNSDPTKKFVSVLVKAEKKLNYSVSLEKIKKEEERIVSEQAPPSEKKKEKPDRVPMPEDLKKEKKQII